MFLAPKILETELIPCSPSIVTATHTHCLSWVGRNGLPPTPDNLHLGCSYHLHSSLHFLPTWVQLCSAVIWHLFYWESEQNICSYLSSSTFSTFLLLFICLCIEPSRSPFYWQSGIECLALCVSLILTIFPVFPQLLHFELSLVLSCAIACLLYFPMVSRVYCGYSKHSCSAIDNTVLYYL